MSAVVRRAVAADRTPLAALERELFGIDAWSPASVLDELTGEGRRAVVAEDDGEVVGYAVTRRVDDVVDLQRIAVAPTHRRSGVARALLAALRTEGRADGGHRMLLEVSAANAGARAFYAREGFVQIDSRPRYYRDGSDALVLRAPLGGAACGGRTT